MARRAGGIRCGIYVTVKSEWLDLVDRLRGDESRGLWLRRVLWRELKRRGFDLEEHVHRDTRHLRLPRKEHKRREYERQQERRAWAAKQAKDRYQERGGALGNRVRRMLKRYEAIAWQFRDDGGVVASDVQAQDAGYVDAEGAWHAASRHGARVIAWAVMRAMEMDRERAWGERWHRLIEREGRPRWPADPGKVRPRGEAAREALARKRESEKRERELRELGEQ